VNKVEKTFAREPSDEELDDNQVSLLINFFLLLDRWDREGRDSAKVM
jgi:hypothetical protein